jgi:hypothetical protein
VSNIKLDEINKMELEFLNGIQNKLYVDQNSYKSWLNLLKGLVAAKEHHSRSLRHSRHVLRVMNAKHAIHQAHHAASVHARTHRHHHVPHRARSTSPTTRMASLPSFSHDSAYPENRAPATAHAAAIGSKRSAEAAFEHVQPPPAKRPVVSVVIPTNGGAPRSGPSTYSPMDGLGSFGNLKITSESPQKMSPDYSQIQIQQQQPAPRPEVLSTGYSLNGQGPSMPQVIFFLILIYHFLTIIL